MHLLFSLSSVCLVNGKWARQEVLEERVVLEEMAFRPHSRVLDGIGTDDL